MHQEPADLRDHDPAVGRAVRQPADDRQAVRPARPRRASSASSATTLEGEALDDDLSPGHRPGRRQEGGHRRGPPRARRAARVRGAGLGRARRLERHLVARRQRHGHASRCRSRGEDRAAEATGNGPVNALFGAVDDALQPVLGWHPTLTEYEIKAVSPARTPRARCSSAAGARRTRARARSSSPATAYRPTSSRPRSRPTSWRSTSSTAPRSTASSVAFVAPRIGETTAVTGTTAAATYRIATIPGDGVGPEVVAAARRGRRRGRRRAFGFGVEWSEHLVGGAAIDAYGVRDPATRTWPPAARPTRSCSARSAARSGPTRARRSGPEQALFALRGGLGLFANLRPVTVHPALVGVVAAPPGAARRASTCSSSAS